ncbi:MAG: type II toxin-antitoxin system PemK/MazF family toxin [Candidatus Rokubacteria bacterium]|nr:type II toxin-antitoxin system PemK/MazF family toxin [Candidatus Rokubacteria bacterium]
MKFSPGRGSEQHGVRPALVVQNDVGNQYAATTIVATITSQIKIYPVTVPLKRGDAGLTKPSMVNLAQILTVDKTRLRRRVGRLSADQMSRVDAALKVSLELE